MNDYLEKYLNYKEGKDEKDEKGEKGKHINSSTPQRTNSQTFKPSYGFRLDKDTSGVLIAAKNYEALQYINKIIRDRKINKKYLTIVV